MSKGHHRRAYDHKAYDKGYGNIDFSSVRKDKEYEVEDWEPETGKDAAPEEKEKIIEETH